MNSYTFEDNYKHNIERRRKFSLPGYKSLAGVGFDGEYVTPAQIKACSETGICLVSHNWFDVKSLEEYSRNPKKYQSLKEKGYDESIPFNRVLDLALDKVGIRREDTYMTQVFHLLPATQKEPPSEEDVWKSFEAITQYEIQGRKVIALGKAAKTACIRFGIQNFAGYAHAVSPSLGFRQGTPDDEYATKIANAIKNVLLDNRIYSFYGASGSQYEYYLPQDPNTIPAVAGNYMLATLQNYKWRILYVGQSENLRNHLVGNRHEKMTNATVWAYPNPVRVLYDANQWNQDVRRKAERDLIEKEFPPLNSQYPTQNDKHTQQKTKQERIDSLIKWFRENYQHPEVELPYDKEEEKYIFAYGGPYDANDVLTERFPKETEEIIKAAVEKIESDGTFDWSPIQHEGNDELAHNNLKDIKTKLNSLIANSPISRVAPAFNLGDDGLLHINFPPDLQDIASSDDLFEQLKEAKDDLKKSLTGNNAHPSLSEAVKQYDRVFSDERISISSLYARGIRLENAVNAIRQSIKSEDLPSFSVDIEQDINSVLDLHGTYIMSQEEGRARVEEASAYRQSAQQTEESRIAAEKLNDSIASDTILFGDDVKEYIADVVQDIGKGPYPERSNQVATVTFISLVSTIGVNIVSAAFEASTPGTLLMISGTEIIDATWSFLSTAIPSLKIIVAPVASDASWIASFSDLVDRFKNLQNPRDQGEVSKGMIEKIHISTLLKNLAEERPVFHSKADFQSVLAQWLREVYPHLRVGIKYSLGLFNHEDCDIVLLQGDRIMMAIELRYSTRELEYENKGELFTLKRQGAQNFGRYSVLQGIERMECFLERNPKTQASVIFVTNEHIYWEGSRKGKDDEEFDIRDKTIVTGMKNWKEGSRNYKKSPVNIRGRYKMEWQDYSKVNGKFGLFRCLYIPIQQPETW